MDSMVLHRAPDSHLDIRAGFRFSPCLHLTLTIMMILVIIIDTVEDVDHAAPKQRYYRTKEETQRRDRLHRLLYCSAGLLR